MPRAVEEAQDADDGAFTFGTVVVVEVAVSAGVDNHITCAVGDGARGVFVLVGEGCFAGILECYIFDGYEAALLGQEFFLIGNKVVERGNGVFAGYDFFGFGQAVDFNLLCSKVGGYAPGIVVVGGRAYLHELAVGADIESGDIDDNFLPVLVGFVQVVAVDVDLNGSGFVLDDKLFEEVACLVGGDDAAFDDVVCAVVAFFDECGIVAFAGVELGFKFGNGGVGVALGRGYHHGRALEVVIAGRQRHGAGECQQGCIDVY